MFHVSLSHCSSPHGNEEKKEKAAPLCPCEGQVQTLCKGGRREWVSNAILEDVCTCLPEHNCSLLSHLQHGLRSQVVAFLAL